MRSTRFMQVFAEYQKACAQVRTLFVVHVWLFVCHHDIELQPSCAFAFAFHNKTESGEHTGRKGGVAIRKRSSRQATD